MINTLVIFLGELFHLNPCMVCVMSHMSGSFVCEGYGDWWSFWQRHCQCHSRGGRLKPSCPHQQHGPILETSGSWFLPYHCFCSRVRNGQLNRMPVIKWVSHCYLGSIHSYNPVSASVRVLETRVEQVDFKLTRDALQPSVEEGEQNDFEKMVERLLAPGELDQLVRSLLPAQTLRYRTYRERSEFLRGLTLNFPRITRLYRYVILKMCLWFLASTTNHLIKTSDYWASI